MSFKKIDIELKNYHCPLGYNLDKENNIFIINSEESVIVQKIFELRIDGLSIRQIASNLEASFLLTKNQNAKWYPNAIRFILKNPSYLGMLFIDNKLYKNTHIPIIKDEVFLEANNYLTLKHFIMDLII